MKTITLAFVMLIACSSFALECEIGKAKAKLTVVEKGHYSLHADGYAW